MIEVKIVSVILLGFACFNLGFSACNLIWTILEHRDTLFKKKRQNRCNKR